MRLGLLVLVSVFASGGCAQHCEWIPFVEESSWATAEGAITGGGRDVAFDDAPVETTSGPVARLRFTVATGEPTTDGLAVHVWTLPRQTGVHAIDASVLLPDAARIETSGAITLEAYSEITERNPNDAYTSGGTVTAVQIAGTMSLTGENDEGLAVDLALAFDIDESLRRDCFDCPGFEGCDY